MLLASTADGSDHVGPPVEVGGGPSPDAVREFWQAFARIALELLDANDLTGDDHAREEPAA